MCHSFDTGPPVVTRQSVPILGLGEKRTIFRVPEGSQLIMDIMVASPGRTFTFPDLAQAILAGQMQV